MICALPKHASKLHTKVAQHRSLILLLFQYALFAKGFQISALTLAAQFLLLQIAQHSLHNYEFTLSVIQTQKLKLRFFNG